MALEYSARDDFGISEVNLVAKVGDREDKIRTLLPTLESLISEGMVTTENVRILSYRARP